MEQIRTKCCIAGGGPAGMMLGFLLARAGVDVVVLEKHDDFLRDFRGDTIHPSTLELLHELGLLSEFLTLPHEKASEIVVHIGGRFVPVADFSRLPTVCKFIAFVPQWDFLNFIAERGRRYPRFDLRMRAEVKELIVDGGRVAGVTADTDAGPLEIRADLVVGADGRGSRVREAAVLPVRSLGAPMDVLWFRLSRADTDPDETMGRFAARQIFVMIDRGDYWQCGYVIAKGSYDMLRRRGLEALRERISSAAPFAADRLDEIASWDDVNLLTVRVDRLPRWHRDGLLCIGDAAHAMSPVGGVGINLAVQDAVAAANLLWRPLSDGRPDSRTLASVQRRRRFPTALTQRLQVLAQDRIVGNVLESSEALSVPFPLRLLERYPMLRRVPGRMIGIGVRPEHVRSPDCTVS